MRIREFEANSQDYEALAHIVNTVWHELVYTADDLRQRDKGRPPQLVHHRFLAERAGRVLGFGSFEQHIKFYHPQRFWMNLAVLPDQRQQGIGSLLYNHMLAMLQGYYKASELYTVTTECRHHSLHFLNERGFQTEKRDPKSCLELADFDPKRFAGLEEQIAAAGIEIRVLDELLQQDGDCLHKIYEMHQLLVSQVPEPAEHTRVDFESWREGYSTSNAYFIPEANFMALRDGIYVGLASLWGRMPSTWLHTGMTGVRAAYRRQGIATALKLRTVSFAQAQGVRRIMTSNNDQNPMYRLNLKLGFQTYDTEIKLRKPLHPRTGLDLE